MIAFFVQLVRRDLPNWVHKVGPWALGGAMVAHGSFVTAVSFIAHVCPVESVHFALSVASLVAIIVFLIARKIWSLDAVGAFIAPLGMTFLLGTRIIGLESGGPKLPPMFLTLHVASNLLGEALFLLSSATAVLYLYAEKRLKERRGASLVGRLPPLDALDRAEHKFLLLGFPLLTLGIVTGTAWAHKLETGTAGELLRAAIAYLTWIVFAAVLLLRAAAGWRGRRAAMGTIAGFLLTILVLLMYLVRPAPNMQQTSIAQVSPKSNLVSWPQHTDSRSDSPLPDQRAHQ